MESRKRLRSSGVAHVIKRSGHLEMIDESKIYKRIQNISFNLPAVDVDRLATIVIQGLKNKIKTSELDTLAAETAASLILKHHDYATLAGRIEVSNLHKETADTFSEAMRRLYNHFNVNVKKWQPIISEELMLLINKHTTLLDTTIVMERDYDLDFFGVRTLKHKYLLRTHDQIIVERPQYMFMRVALGIHGSDITSAIDSYHHMSLRHFTHATPTLYNAGTKNAQMASCFLLQMRADSIEGIYETKKQIAVISKHAGGIAVNVSEIRAQGSYVAGTGGISNGLVPMLQTINSDVRYVDQGGGKRKGSVAIYCEPWHADIIDVLHLKRADEAPERQALDLFYALWIPDLFMRRLFDGEADGMWTLFCPHTAPGLCNVYGKEFDDLYLRYEQEGLGVKCIPAKTLWDVILTSQICAGAPYILFKDACNSKSNHKHLGTIRNSNLCTEIIQYSSPEEIAVCNLASINLRTCVINDTGYDFVGLANLAGILVRNLNRVIDRTFYPLPETQKSNLRHRPIGLGVQGLAEVFFALRLPFESDEARALNRDIFEAIYYGACNASMELAKIDGPYETYAGSPMSCGIFQMDMWGEKTRVPGLDWEELRRNVAKFGMRNSLLVAPMPTASTAQILGNTECFEPITSNILARNVLSGTYFVVNRALM